MGIEKTHLQVRAERVKQYVSKFKNRGAGIRNAVKTFGYCRKTIYNYLNM